MSQSHLLIDFDLVVFVQGTRVASKRYGSKRRKPQELQHFSPNFLFDNKRLRNAIRMLREMY